MRSFFLALDVKQKNEFSIREKKYGSTMLLCVSFYGENDDDACMARDSVRTVTPMDRHVLVVVQS